MGARGGQTQGGRTSDEKTAPAILRVAKLMHVAYGGRAADQAHLRALECADRSDVIAADFWASVAVANRCYGGREWDEP